MIRIVNVQLHGRSRYYQADAGDLDLKPGDAVIVEDEQGTAFAYTMISPYQIASEIYQEQPLKIVRPATADDRAQFDTNCEDEKEALQIACERVESHELEMNLISAYYPFDRHKLLFYFTADGRIDFRELVRDLAAIFHTRIELRQIGVRDEAGMIGGLGVCGRELCCASFLKSFSPVSIRMAKDQSLSMNPAKISGSCGRLLCCLNYEQEAYVSAARDLPSKNSKIRYQSETGNVESVNLLKETLQVRFERSDGPAVVELKAAEVDVIYDPGKQKSEAQKAQKIEAAVDQATTAEDKKEKLKFNKGKARHGIRRKKIKSKRQRRPKPKIEN
ncbi:MAG: PSP1 domain-containing protein [Saccharofermentanales bacterium]|jgi:cell fate regulator YaaT (PSP1 superfamily)|nr:stage 0 sporulation family protein [Bacillota bacterium]NLB08580.1 stage 0 sporulation family protein [Clostridiales bacterium]